MNAQDSIWRNRAKTAQLSSTAVLASLYVLSTFVPLTPFIGGPTFISLEIVMVPVIGALLKPVQAGFVILVGSLGIAVAQSGLYQVFGVAGVSIPIIATVMGSIAYHNKSGPILSWAYVAFGALYYYTFSQGGTLLWLIPYAIVILSLPLVLRLAGNYRVWLLAFYTTMTEVVTMNVLSISLLGLVDGIWLVITPLMFVERVLATIGGGSVITAVTSRLNWRDLFERSS